MNECLVASFHLPSCSHNVLYFHDFIRYFDLMSLKGEYCKYLLIDHKCKSCLKCFGPDLPYKYILDKNSILAFFRTPNSWALPNLEK